ncbi:MAG: FtsX-like permease family protein [Gammaproteobacteria bacterium]|nr:FtsX-like permease family protein [Gammaproteobacteria bacterium]
MNISGLPAIQSYWLMLIATVITIAIVNASQLITQRISLLLDRQASELLAADLVVISNHPFIDDYAREASRIGLQVSTTISLTTAIFIDDDAQLVELKAVDRSYPLRGQLERAADLVGHRTKVNQGPAAGEVWLDSKLFSLLGDTLTIGSLGLRASWLLSYEPDRGGTLFNLAPRILMNLEDLPGTELVVAGSRVEYRLLFAGEQEQITELTAWLRPRLAEAERIQNLENARPEMRQALERTRKFFALSIVLTLVIAMVAIAITARYTASQEAPKIAMLRAFGISQSRLYRFYAWQLAKIWIIATLIGIAAGWFSQFPLQWTLDGWFGKSLPQVFTIRPFLIAAVVGFISLVGFSLPYLVNVIATPPMQVFRHISDPQSMRRKLMVSGVAIASVFLVLVVLMQNSLLAIVTLAIVLLVALLLPLIFHLMINLLLSTTLSRFWMRQYLLSRLKTSARGAIFVMSGFSLALLAILLIVVVKNELLDSWQTQLPDDIPNYFLINIPTGKVNGIKQFLDDREVSSSVAYPLVRARMTHINGQAVDTIEFSDPRAHHLARHTFNLSYAEDLPDDNAVVEGEWIDSANTRAQLSVEQGLAKTLRIDLGDTLSFSVGSELFEAPVTNIRSVLWENFKPNFFIIANRQLIEDLPQTWLLSALIKDAQKSDLKQLLSRFPSLTLLDITELMARMRGIVERASIALEFFFIFALASAFIVLLAAIQTGKRERQMESSLLRAMSAKTSQLYRINVLEFTLMGSLVGLFSAMFASLSAWFISDYFFDINYQFSPALWAYSLLSAGLILTIAGILVSRKVYNISPMRILRT